MFDFDTAIRDLDLGLFERIESQTTVEDRRSLLACQAGVRDLRSGYCYLEIGSYLGGTIQPHLLDPRCRAIVSVDKRPAVQPDERGVPYFYRNNSTARMIELLGGVSPEGLGKLRAFDADTRELDPRSLSESADVCLVDAEHTDAAVYGDFVFCLGAIAGSGLIVFHDAPIVYNGLVKCVEHLESVGVEHRAYGLPNTLFVVEVGDFPVHRHPDVFDRLVNNSRGYLFSLQLNDGYRRFANKKVFRTYRRLVSRWRGTERFD